MLFLLLLVLELPEQLGARGPLGLGVLLQPRCLQLLGQQALLQLLHLGLLVRERVLGLQLGELLVLQKREEVLLLLLHLGLQVRVLPKKLLVYPEHVVRLLVAVVQVPLHLREGGGLIQYLLLLLLHFFLNLPLPILKLRILLLHSIVLLLGFKLLLSHRLNLHLHF